MLAGCSLVFDLDAYDRGAGGAGGAGATSTSTTVASAGGAGGAGGGEPACEGTFTNPPLDAVVATFDAGFSPLAPQGSCVTVDAGTALFAPTAMPTDFCWVAVQGPHRLTCSSLTFRVLEATNGVLGAQTFVYLQDASSGAEAYLLLEGGGFGLNRADGSAPIPFMGSDVYSPDNDRWWRLRADLTTLYFETSKDGVNWTLRAAGEPPVPLDSLLVQIGSGIYDALQGAPGQTRIDCVNAGPPCGE